jgi:hypothetical protein
MDNDEQIQTMSAGIACVHERQRLMMNVSSELLTRSSPSESPKSQIQIGADYKSDYILVSQHWTRTDERRISIPKSRHSQTRLDGIGQMAVIL